MTTTIRLAIDRGNQAIKWQAHVVESGKNYSGKFASLLLKNPEKQIKPVTVAGESWLYGSYAGKVGLAIAESPSQKGVNGKVESFAIVLAAVLQELSNQVKLDGDVVVEKLGITTPIASSQMTDRYKAELSRSKFKDVMINGSQLEVSVLKSGIVSFAESAVILERVSNDIVLDVGFGTVLGSFRGWAGVETLTADHGAEQLIKTLSTHPDFLGQLANTDLKAAPSIPSIALQLAKGSVEVSGIDTRAILARIVPAWYEQFPLKLLPQLQRWARESDRSEKALLTGGGAQLLSLALGENANLWAARYNCEVAADADFLAVRVVSEILSGDPEAKKQSTSIAA